MSREWVSLRIRPESLAYARQVATDNDEPVSAVLRRLLALGVAAHQGKPAAVPVVAELPKPQTAPRVPKQQPGPPRLVTVDTPPPKPQTSACRQCSTCPDYRPNPKRMLHCDCGHGIGVHR
jgi:hypothetical protein